MLVAVGLWASLVPQVTFQSASSGEPSSEVLVAWPEWGVEQDLGTLRGAVSRIRIWVSAHPDGDKVTVHAALLESSTREVVRQASFDASPSYIPVPHTIVFPGYVVPDGERLILQLRVATSESYSVIYRLTHPNPEIANPTLNGAPDAGMGPLAFAHMYTGYGLRAAILGEHSGQIRLVLAGILSVVATLMHPHIASGLRKFKAAARRLAKQLVASWSNFVGIESESEIGDSPTTRSLVLSMPWYPWPTVAVPILHFLATNQFHFVASEAMVPLALALVLVGGSVAILWLLLKDLHRSAAVTAAVTAIVFGYGHVEHALDSRIDERVLFAGSAVLVVAVTAGIIWASELAARATQFLNLAVLVLVAFPVVSLVGDAPASVGSTSTGDLNSTGNLVRHLLPGGMPVIDGRRPDIYYVLLDEYARHDALGGFDNTDFVRELERRGFYVAAQATSNYWKSLLSIPSILNMSYLSDLGSRSPANEKDILDISRNHSLAAIVKSAGYTYVHLESGHVVSNKAPLADILVRFTPSGVIVGKDKTQTIYRHYSQAIDASQSFVSNRFVRALADTTALAPLVSRHLLPDGDVPYDWWSPHRARQMLEFLGAPIQIDGPKMVFAHIVKPHLPATFDRYGKSFVGTSEFDGFTDEHDPSVPNAYTGQLIHLNSLVLKMVDSIFRNESEEPVIVIAGDHGRRVDGLPRYSILAAFYLPDGASAHLYPSISSVNHFRLILDAYLGLDLGLLPDKRVSHETNQFHFRG